MNQEQATQTVADDTNTIELADNHVIDMSVEQLDDGSSCISFDILDMNDGDTVANGGCVITNEDYDKQRFVIKVFQGNGQLMSVTFIPFNFESFEDE